MILKRQSDERGHADHGWLDSYHTFSFAGYYDPDFMGFGPLRVINQDRVAPAAGFGEHPHHDMEIITYVTEGELEHRDSMGTGSVIRPGDVQRMSAGTGVTHSEFNHSTRYPVRFLQIWIIPDEKGIVPEYEQRHFDDDEKKNRLCPIASADGKENSLTIHQDVDLFACSLDEKNSVEHTIAEGRKGWIQVIRGPLQLNDIQLVSGDGAAILEESLLKITADEESEFLLFDLP